MELNLVELHKRSTKDVDGYEVGRQRVVQNSEAFRKFLDRFLIFEKYMTGEFTLGVITNREGKITARTETYFSSWIRDEVTGKREMCYIVIEYPVPPQTPAEYAG